MIHFQSQSGTPTQLRNGIRAIYISCYLFLPCLGHTASVWEFGMVYSVWD